MKKNEKIESCLRDSGEYTKGSNLHICMISVKNDCETEMVAKNIRAEISVIW